MTHVVAAITLSPRDFDDFLQQRAIRTGEAFVPFDVAADYPRHVDGKARHAGAAAPISLCVDGRSCEFVSGTTRVFQLNDGTAPGAAGDHGKGPA